MSSLTKKLIFFFVFSILSNFATSADPAIKDCELNINEIFMIDRLNERLENFDVAMTALSENLLNMAFLHEKANNLYGYFKPYGDEIKNMDDKILRSKHKAVLQYFKLHKSQKEGNKVSTLAEKQRDIVGYFRSFAAKIDNPDYPDASTWINFRTFSPLSFCYYQVYSDIDTCIKALCIMFDLRADDPAELENFYTWTASKAFKYCYLNYTYIDFTSTNLSSRAGSSSGSLQSRLDQNESIKQLQINQRLFLTTFEYCAIDVQQSRQNETLSGE